MRRCIRSEIRRAGGKVTECLLAPWTFRHEVDGDVDVNVDCITSICIFFDNDTDLYMNETMWSGRRSTGSR
jgi:hypothetical protein